MALITFSKLFTLIIVGYLCHSMYSFYNVFHYEQCVGDSLCIYPKLESELEYKLTLSGRSGTSESDRLLTIDRIRLSDSHERVVAVTVPMAVRRNHSYELHVRLVPWQGENLSRDKALRSSMSLTRLMLPEPSAFHLTDRQKQAERPSDELPRQHVYTRAVLVALADAPVLHYGRVPAEIAPLLRVARDTDGALRYEPLVYLDESQLGPEDARLVSPHETGSFNLTLVVAPTSLGKLRLWRLVEHSTADLRNMGFTEKNIASVRGLFTHTNFYLLMMTFSVAVVHLLFDILSFKNDISFWRAAKSTEGISSRTVVWRCVSGLVILLYLLEEQTSLLVLGPFVVGLLVELWKLARVGRVLWGRAAGTSTSSCTSAEIVTSNYDAEGMRYLLWAIVPLCAVGAGYSLLYMPHKSWYSWTINTLANGVYVFGFMFMTPQLFINYKLKSVAHLPWKALTYKAFNTFIDDFFAFIISMPTSHRLACFRDDVVFMIYLYQRWLYPVDKSRNNEFGVSFQGDQSQTAKKDQ